MKINNMVLKVIRKILRIEYILVFIATLSFAFTLLFKNLELKNFNSFLSRLNEIYNKKTVDHIGLEKLKKDFKQFTYYNETLDTNLQNFIETVKKQENPTPPYLSVLKEMYRNQQQLIFGYECLIYISFFIELVAILVFFQKNSIQKNELIITRAIHENQINFSREIHDGVAQDLAALKICLDNNTIEKAHYFADQAFNEIRFLIETTHLDLTKNFPQILKETLSAFEVNFSINTEFLNASTNLELSSNSIKLELLKILNEALSNVARHSKATKVTLKITDYSSGIRIIISDNGIGINQTMSSDKQIKHYGIENIKARVKSIHGTVDFINEGGTKIAITIKNSVS